MEKKLISCTVVPQDLYVERFADRQIKKIIDGMGRPGYVLVARQMGKTNLLLHTKHMMESKRVVFTYIDFSSLSSLDEKEFFSSMIEEVIDTHNDIFSIAAEEIRELRKTAISTGPKLFNKELRILLKYVDKLIFILDEIDALSNTNYSDRVFSTIRSHYFQRDNYPELKKLTYILSGVVEPKDIIKDPNISPFNIGEKIYLQDFSKDEFETFLKKSGLYESLNNELIDRIFYWTAGNPRITWDLCSMIEEYQICSIRELDNLVNKSYLTTFDKAPIDSIREKVKHEPPLRDALIQMFFNKGESLSDEVKSKLYLAGIIDYKESTPYFKNPILEKSLTYEWLMSLQDQQLNYLSIADKSIHLEHDYKKAMAHINKFLESEPTNIDEIDKANYLLSEVYLRTYDSKQSLNLLDNITNKTSKYYYDALLLKGYNYASLSDYEKAESCYQEILKANIDHNSDTFLKANIGYIDVLVSSDESSKWSEANDILKKLINEIFKEQNNINILATYFFYLACIEEKKKNHTKVVEYIDAALNYAQRNERPILLYKKLINAHSDLKPHIVTELYDSLSYIKSRPEPENFENTLGFNLMYACMIISEFMLYYKNFDILQYLRTFLSDSKENAVIYVYQLLEGIEHRNADSFLDYLIDLTTNSEWYFENDNLAYIGILELQKRSKIIILKQLFDRVINSPCYEISDNLFFAIQHLTYYYLNNKMFNAGEQLYIFYNSHIEVIKCLNEGHRLLMDYYYALILNGSNNIIKFKYHACGVIARSQKYISQYETINGNKLEIKTVQNIIRRLTNMLKNIHDREKNLGIINNYNNIERNCIVKVRYYYTNEIIKQKFKYLKTDITNGMCEVLEIIKK